MKISVPDLSEKRILVTGSSGFIGKKLGAAITSLGGDFYPCDVEGGVDILHYGIMRDTVKNIRPDIIIHLAAHKYATVAEWSPAIVAELNIIGTHNVVESARLVDAKVVFASTCKAVNPCTAYGASKLIGERIVSNYVFGVVFRLVNVLGSTGSVTDIWDSTPADDILVTDCIRYFIHPDEAVNYLLACTNLPGGVYIPEVPTRITMMELLKRYDPDNKRVQKMIPLRRGDRPVERLIGEYELSTSVGNHLQRIKGPWDA